jgi:tRNA threonylcarbamoyladenosine biosynthesis protein TsaB
MTATEKTTLDAVAGTTITGTILAIDAAGHGCSVALWRDNALAVTESRMMSHGQASELVPMVERVMSAGDLDLRQVERVAVAVGPGGFTGLRIGLATARGLGLAIGCPVIGISSFQATAAALSPSQVKPGSADLLVALDSRRTEPYLARLSSDLVFRQPPKLLDMVEIEILLTQPDLALICGDGLQNLATLIPPGLPQFPAASDAALVARLAAQPARRFDLPPDPQYLRPPDISQPKVRI